MPSYDIAHIREQGVDLIIIPLQATFATLPATEQDATIAELESRAHSAGLAGTVVPVWNAGGRMAFRAPQNFHPFFRSISLAFVAQNINRNLHW